MVLMTMYETSGSDQSRDMVSWQSSERELRINTSWMCARNHGLQFGSRTLTIPQEGRYPGSGMHMVVETYRSRDITEADRATTARRVASPDARGDEEDAQFWRDSPVQWEAQRCQ